MKTLISLLYFVSLCDDTFAQGDLRRPPWISRVPKTNIIFMPRYEIELSCEADGMPAVTYLWMKNGEQLNLTRGNDIRTGSHGNLVIRPATQLDEGFYQCFAANRYGTALSTVAHAQMAYLEDVPQGDIVNVTVSEGRPFVIRAVRRKSLPTPDHIWESSTGPHDWSPRRLVQTQRMQMAFNGDLYFAYAEERDNLSGRFYKSVVYNLITDFMSTAGYTRLTVTKGSEPATDFPPSITYLSRSQDVALIGDSIQLKCFASGKPLPAITWSRATFSDLPYGRHRISSFGAELAISNVSASDAGDYLCNVTNSRGSIQIRLNLRVEAAPVFRRYDDGPYNVNATEGDSVTFNCSAFAIPNATIVWLLNGQPLEVENRPKRFVFSRDKRTLTIKDVCRDCDDRDSKTDLMVIQCNASNVHGYAFASGYLNVLLRTRVTSLPKSTFQAVNLSIENRFEFVCSATSDPSTRATVRWFRVWNNVLEPVYSRTPYLYVLNGNLTIQTERQCCDACDGYLGEYRCIAETYYSRDYATVILDPTRVKTEVAIKGSKDLSVDFLEETNFIFQCSATTDPCRPTILQWYKTEPYDDRVLDEPPYVYVTKGVLIIIIDPKCSKDCVKHLGEYRCESSDGYSRINRTITLSYQPKASTEMEKEESWTGWKYILSAGAVGVVLFLLGMYLGFRSKNRLDVFMSKRKECRQSNPPNIGDLPLKSLTNDERSTSRPCSLYEHVGYDSIDQVLEDIARRGSSMHHSPGLDGYKGYEAVDETPKDAMVSDIKTTLDGDTMNDDSGYLMPQEKVTNCDIIDKNQVQGYESVKLSSEMQQDSNAQSNSMNVYTDLKPKTINSNSTHGQIEITPNLDPCSVEGIHTSEDKDRKEVNPYLDMSKKVDPTLNSAPGPNSLQESIALQDANYLVLEN